MYTFLKDINWEELYSKCTDEKYTAKAKIHIREALKNDHQAFLNTIYPILASVKLIAKDGKFSPSQTLAALGDVIETPYLNFSKDQFRGYFMLVTKIAPTAWIRNPMTQEPKFSALTPLFLAAHKLHNDVDYESWDFEDPAIKHLLSDRLIELRTFKDHDFSTIDKLKLRDEVMLVKKSGEIQDPIKYPTSKTLYIGDMQVKATALLPVILSQVWLANKKYRTNLMVLDPNNWDSIPPAIDVKIEEVTPVIMDMPF